MIEQTPLILTEWKYNAPEKGIDGDKKIITETTLEVMKKTAATKKGLAFRFSCQIAVGYEKVLDYVGEDSYVIDLEDEIDKKELETMIRNSFSKFNEAFEQRKQSTILNHTLLTPVDETRIAYDSILDLIR